MKTESAFTGLEAAIVLIAFVVVAAVFSYVMLGAGFFATQKSQEVTYSGIKQATSNVVLEGQIYGTMDSSSKLQTLTFYIRVPEGGESVKMGDITFLYSITSNAATPKTNQNSGSSTTSKLAPGSDTKIVLGSTASPLNGPGAGSKFTLEIKPNVGASTLIQRTLASGYDGGVII